MATTDVGSAVGMQCAPPKEQECTREGRRSDHFGRNVLLIMDFLLLSLGALLAWYIRFVVQTEQVVSAAEYAKAAARHAAFLLLYIVLFVLFGYARKLYLRPWIKRAAEETSELCKAAGSAGLVLMSAIYVSGEKIISREVVGAAIILGTLLVLTWRVLLRHAGLSGLIEQHNVLIIGAGRVGRALHQYLSDNPQLGYQVQGFIDRRLAGRYDDPADACEHQKFLGTIDDIEIVARARFVDEILVTLPTDRNLVIDVALQAQRAGINLRVVPDLYDGLGLGAPIEFVGQFPTMALHRQPIPSLQLTLKRCVDVLASATALVLLAPVFLLVALAIKLDSKGPVFYHSSRVGKKGRTFTCHKFRTMVVDAEEQKKTLAHLNERDGVLFKISNDPRVTGVGRFLRKFSIDELPQFWNVLKGQMSLVGPRPPVPNEYTQYALQHLRRLEVVPGITGLWQVEARQSPSFEDYISFDLAYVENWSVWLDLKLICRTIKVVLAGTGQ